MKPWIGKTNRDGTVTLVGPPVETLEERIRAIGHGWLWPRGMMTGDLRLAISWPRDLSFDGGWILTLKDSEGSFYALEAATWTRIETNILKAPDGSVLAWYEGIVGVILAAHGIGVRRFPIPVGDIGRAGSYMEGIEKSPAVRGLHLRWEHVPDEANAEIELRKAATEGHNFTASEISTITSQDRMRLGGKMGGVETAHACAIMAYTAYRL